MSQEQTNKSVITVQNRSSDSVRLYQSFADYLNDKNIDKIIHDDMRLVLEETFINIVSYAFPAGETKDISIEFCSTSDTISITFIDNGIAFNPLDCEKDIAEGDLSCGGMGIHLIKSLTDTQHYDRIEHRNVFTVTKSYTRIK